jgi:hypothetical protein
MEQHEQGTEELADGARRISEVDRARVRELKRIAVYCLTEMNAILAPAMGVDPDAATEVRLGLRGSDDAVRHDGVPPVYSDPCHTVYGPDGCLYQDCDPPGVTAPCHVVVLPPS